MKFRVGAGIAGVLAGLCLGAVAARADIQAKEVAAKDTWIYGIHIGDPGGAGNPFVIEMSKNCPAKLAGLKKGDEIVRVQDQPVRGMHDLVQDLNELHAGRIVKLAVDRGAAPVSIEFFSPGRPKNGTKSAALRQSGEPASSPGPAVSASCAAATTSTAGGDAPAAKKSHKKGRHGKKTGEGVTKPATTDSSTPAPVSDSAGK